MKIFYNKAQSVKKNNSYSPSAQKPAFVIEEWMKLGLPLEIVESRCATIEEISLAHDKDYVQKVLGLETINGFGNKDANVAKSLPYVVGSAIDASTYAAKYKAICATPTSGSHHAMYDYGMKFCTFRSLIVAIMILKKNGLVNRVGLIDFDAHFPEGHLDAVSELQLDYVVELNLATQKLTTKTSQYWIDNLPKLLTSTFSGCDFIIYNAGMDSSADDDLGSGVFSDDQLHQREKSVFKLCADRHIGCAFALAGSYQPNNIQRTLDLHNITAIEWARAIGKLK